MYGFPVATSTENADQLSRSLLKFREPGFARGSPSSVLGIRSKNPLRMGTEAADGRDGQSQSDGGGEYSNEEDRKTPEEHGSIWFPCLPDRDVPPVPLHRYNADNQEGPDTDGAQKR